MSTDRWIKEEYLGQEPVLDRSSMLSVIKEAGLSQALHAHLNRDSKELVDAGANEIEIKNMRLQDFTDSVFPTLPPQAVQVIIRWLAEMSNSEFEQFKKQNKGDLDRKLCEYLFPLRLHLSEVGEKPSDLVRRSRIFLACLGDKEAKDVISALMSLSCAPSSDALTNIYETIRPVVDDPGKLVSNPSSYLHSDLALACAVSIRARNREDAMTLLKEVGKRDNAEPKEARMHDSLSVYCQREMPKQTMKIAKLKRGSLDRIPGIAGLHVLAECNKVEIGERAGSSFAFSRVLAVCDPEEGTWYGLDDMEIKELFPSSGSIIHLDGKQFPQLPRHMSYAVWVVEEQSMSTEDSERFKTRVRASHRICTAHRVLHLEHVASGEHGLARQWLRNTPDLSVEAEGERLLRFEDGLFVHTSSSYSNLIEENFSQGLRSWHDLPMLDARMGINLYVGDLPEEFGEYHLTPPVGALGRKLRQMKNCTASEKDLFTKAIAAMGENHALCSRLAELKVDDIEFDETYVNRVVDLLVQSESFRTEIERQSMIHSKEATGNLQEVEKEYEFETRIIESINKLIARKKELIKNAEASMNESEKALRQDIQKDGRKFYELIQMYSAATTAELEERIAALEKRLGN